MLFLVAGPAVSSVVISNDPGTSYLPADLSAIPVEPLEGPSVGANAELIVTSAPVTIVSPVDSGANLRPVSAEGESGILLNEGPAVSSSEALVEAHGGEDSPPSEEEEDEGTRQTQELVSSQVVTSPRFSSYLSGVAQTIGSKTSSPTVEVSKEN